MTTLATPSTSPAFNTAARTAEMYSLAAQIRHGEANGLSPADIAERRDALRIVMREIAAARGIPERVAASRAAHVQAEAAARADVEDEIIAPRSLFADAEAVTRAELAIVGPVEIIDAEVVEDEVVEDEVAPEVYLPAANASNVRDPDYIHARIQKALRDATEYRPKDIGPDRAEVISLTVSFESLAQDLQFHGPAGDAFVAHLEAIAPGDWGRAATIYTWAPDEATALDYAARLGIPEIQPYRGRVWRGMYRGFKVSVYGPAR